MVSVLESVYGVRMDEKIQMVPQIGRSLWELGLSKIPSAFPGTFVSTFLRRSVSTFLRISVSTFLITYVDTFLWKSASTFLTTSVSTFLRTFVSTFETYATIF